MWRGFNFQKKLQGLRGTSLRGHVCGHFNPKLNIMINVAQNIFNDKIELDKMVNSFV